MRFKRETGAQPQAAHPLIVLRAIRFLLLVRFRFSFRIRLDVAVEVADFNRSLA
jgi:hypothetical protein